jgi:hypothetical protein
MRLTSDDCWDSVRSADHGILCTSKEHTVDAVPVCFAVVSKRIATPIDLVKPKETTALGRLKNLERDAAATLLCEHWDRHDWSQLWWVRVQLVRRSGHALSSTLLEECEKELRQKYVQYHDADFAEIIVFDVKNMTGWAAADKKATEGEV